MERFEGKVAFVTGAARGQGRAHARALAAEGAHVVATDICRQIPSVPYRLATREDLKETGAEISKSGHPFVTAECDVRSMGELASTVKAATERLGPIDILVANAGIFGIAPVWELAEDAWEDVIAVNLTGAWKTIRAVLPSMMQHGSGSIVITASVNGLEAGHGFSHYVASKHGVIGLMRSVALELGSYNIRCNAVLPGAVDTPMTDWQGAYDMMAGGAAGTPEDRRKSGENWSVLGARGLLDPSAVSRAVLWLASDDAADITGACLPVDAGHLVQPGRR